jgi:anthranilate/para-aminobenzoate synthase component II
MKNIFVLGDRNTSFVTHRELDAAIRLLPGGVRAHWIGTDTPDAARTSEADAVWVVPGSPYRHDAAVYSAITSARTSGQPFLGTCAGFQYAVVEFARNAAGIVDADHAETALESNDLVVDRLGCSLVGQERNITAVPGTRMHNLCGDAAFSGFHCWRFAEIGDTRELLPEALNNLCTIFLCRTPANNWFSSEPPPEEAAAGN